MDPDADVQNLFEHVLVSYREARKMYRTPRKDVRVSQVIVKIADTLQRVLHCRGFLNLIVKRSWGLGVWNPTPWIALLDRRITTTTRGAFYPVFLFRSDGTGVYFAIDLGTGRTEGRATRREIASLQARANQLLPYFESLGSLGFSNNPPMDLRRKQGVAVGFAAGSVTHKLYRKRDIPDSQQLITEIEAVAEEYDRFCSNPDLLELLRLIQVDESDPIVATMNDITRPNRGGQGFVRESGIRSAIERHAMGRAIEYFRELGYEVQDVHMNRPYDLLCTRGTEELMVEVKGTRSDGSRVLLTHGEVSHSRAHKAESTLFVCSNIELELDDDARLKAKGGRNRVFRPWLLQRRQLSPIACFYSVPTD